MIRIAILAALLAAILFAGNARAQSSIVIPSGTVALEYVSSGVRVVDGSGGAAFIGRTFADPVSRTVPIAENYRLGLAGRELTVAAGRSLAPAAVAGAAARMLPYVGAAYMAYQLYDAVRVRPDGQGGLSFDPGVDPETQSVVLWCRGSFTPTTPGECTTAGGIGAHYQAYVQRQFVNWPMICNGGTVAYSSQFEQMAGGTSTIVNWRYGGNCPGFSFSWKNDAYSPMQYKAFTTNQPGCPASIDALNPANSLPAGLPVGPDGKCATARYNHQPISPTAAASRLEQYAPPTGAQLKQMAQDALNQGQSIDATGPRQMSGPASQIGSPTTTTETLPDGSVRTTTKTPTTHYTYNGDTITYNVTNTTVINHNGQTTTIEEGGDPNPDPEDPCNENPDRVGCAKLGEPPTDGPQWQTRDVVFAPENLGFSGACPAPVQWTLPKFGVNLSWSYQPLCDVAPMIRVALVLLATCAAVMIVVVESTKGG